MEQDVRRRLNEFSVAELKAMIRKYNLHHRIMLSQKKDGLIDGLISHLTSEGHIMTSKPAEIDLDKYSPMQRKKAEAKKKAVSEVSGEISSDDELEVTEITQDGIMYLVDKNTGNVYDSKTEKLRRDLTWSKGKGVRTVEAKKKGYTLYRIQWEGNKGKIMETPYLVENAKEGLEFNDRKVYDGRAELKPGEAYIYSFSTNTQIELGGYYGTLGENKRLSKLVRSGKTLLTLEELRAENKIDAAKAEAEREAEYRTKDEAEAKAKEAEAEEREQAALRRAKLKGNVYEVKRFKDEDSDSYFWANKYGDSSAYAIVDGEVKAIGVQGDREMLESYLEPKSIPATVRFFKGKTSQSDPVVILNKAQELREAKKK